MNKYIIIGLMFFAIVSQNSYAQENTFLRENLQGEIQKTCKGLNDPIAVKLLSNMIKGQLK